ncbi:MAG TPA: NAD-dependent epimerase/dehydratase family protein [Iamia sp.]|jgi:nucleoside-diphosphate-sugar epimerase|nr:NAD-dependent epimerase/dehydratase family protein [Iamia sp.]
MSDDTTVLVTGGTGFIGRWCIRELLRRGHAVRTTVRSPARADAVRAAVGGDERLAFVTADLGADAGWAEAVAGCDGVLHVASPMAADADDPDAQVVAARDGARRVIVAAADAGVRRVVMTSAANAASPSSYDEDGITDETLWTDPDDPTLIPYRRSKTLAERAAWEVIGAHAGPTTLATVLPGAVFGPILGADGIGSTQIIRRMLAGEMPGTPRIGLEVVDVRDLVDAHLLALASPAAAGERFLATGTFLWMGDVARILRDGLGDDAAQVPTEEIPDDVIRAFAEHDAELASIVPGLGRRNRHSTAKAEAVLGWRRRPVEDTVLDCARSLIAHGVV